MNKQLIFIPGLFALGILVGIAMMKSRDSDETLVAPDTELKQANPFAVVEGSDNSRVLRLEQEVADLKARIEQLEADQMKPAIPEESTQSMTVDQRMIGDSLVTGGERALKVQNLVKAGIDRNIAEDIVRRINEVELRKLELRDNAAREGYLGTTQYMNELQALNDQEISLREEIGEDSYDRYLFASGQTNRVRVASVMVGSPAEQAGLREGDLILSYDGQNLYEWNELQNATTQGTRDEYVMVSVFRNGSVTNLWIPRGPLGVRLGAMRVKP